MRMSASVDAAAMDPFYTLQADVLKVLANPRRIQILHALAAEPADVSRLARRIGITQPNLSQHLAVMRAAGVVEAERIGRTATYRLPDPDVILACDLMRGVLMRRAQRLGDATGAGAT